MLCVVVLFLQGIFSSFFIWPLIALRMFEWLKLQSHFDEDFLVLLDFMRRIAFNVIVNLNSLLVPAMIKSDFLRNHISYIRGVPFWFSLYSKFSLLLYKCPDLFSLAVCFILLIVLPW